jgi:predicted pyridoxine 5'-phosphate oxidase superfamily flavin-nucleotide-binding protein
MGHRFSEIAFTAEVQRQQERYGSRAQYARLTQRGGDDATLGAREAAFLSRASGFYMATVSESGWPYVQHRGGPRGFLRVLSASRIGFADFRGNRQYISVGNAAAGDRVAIIVMDYANPSRLKLLGHLRFVAVADAEPTLVQALQLPGYPAKVERVALIDVAGFDWNCPQHITRRFALDELPT